MTNEKLGNTVCQNSDKPLDSKVDTKKELSKIANMSYDTYYKGKRILESDDEEIKDKLMKGDIKINKAYNEIFPKNKNSEVKKTEPNIIKNKKLCSKCREYKDNSEFYIGHEKCKECEQFSNSTKYPKGDILKDALGVPLPIKEGSKITDYEFRNMIEDIKTPKNIVDFVDPRDKLDAIEELSEDFMWQLDAKIYTIEKAITKMNKDNIMSLVSILDIHISNVNEFKNKLNNEKVVM